VIFPDHFGYKPSTGKASKEISAKCDLYVYFYLHGLALLNRKGYLCFISSNAWLDVGYGKHLQEFLLEHCRIKFVIDNQKKRSFKSANVNTVIVLFSSPFIPLSEANENVARFTMFQVPYEAILSPVIFEELEEASEKKSTPEYRVRPIRQDSLLVDGSEIPESETEEYQVTSRSEIIPSTGPHIKIVRYIGNKWGGKYLRAPDIYWTIMERAKDMLVRLGDIVDVRRGFTSGVNEFFYLSKEKVFYWGIEERFLVPLIKSPKECKSIVVDMCDLHYHVFICNEDISSLSNSSALEYIKWGESQGFHMRSMCTARKNWYELKISSLPNLIWIKSIHDRYLHSRIPFRALVDQRLYGMSYHHPVRLNIVLNSTLSILFKELIGRVNLGEGALDTTVYEANDLLIFNPQLLNDVDVNMIETSITKRNILSIHEEIHTQEHRDIDEFIFNKIGLSFGEREALLEAVIYLVETRLDKSKSLSQN